MAYVYDSNLELADVALVYSAEQWTSLARSQRPGFRVMTSAESENIDRTAPATPLSVAHLTVPAIDSAVFGPYYEPDDDAQDGQS